MLLKQNFRPPFNQDNIPKELLELDARILSSARKRPTWDTIIDQLSQIRVEQIQKERKRFGYYHN
ncbi:hypothetical protein [Endozoicomonas lisbonensis]|uniref:Uncharacterized protein n=1 Tax=Endozoicomonas lisbonensis TaxID=3120522 RepID=A0ABV2SMR9_9GAMM